MRYIALDLRWLTLLLLGLPLRALMVGQIQHAEIKAFVVADSGLVQQVTTGFKSSFDENGYGEFGWDFNNSSGASLQNARVIVFIDADLDHHATTFFNEFGALVNLNLPPSATPGDTPATGWEIDEPGFLFGDIAQHVRTGTLDQTNAVPSDAQDDVSFALSFNLGVLLPNAPVNVRCLLSATNIGGLSQTDSDTNTTMYFNGYIQRGQPLVITPLTITRQQGSPATSGPLATVSDGTNAPGSLTVTATTLVPGITITNLTNNDGMISASVATDCTTPSGNNFVGLTVTNGTGLTATANLIVAVTANLPPVLGSYQPVSMNVGGGTTVSPAAAPSDNGAVAGLVALIEPPSFNGALSVNQSTGTVTISNAAPAGSYTVTITATDNCGLGSTRTFGLTVANTSDCVAPNCPTVSYGVGSVLVFSLYASSVSNPNIENTRISLTNTDTALDVNVHLFFIDGSSCTVADAYVCLTPNQTMNILASDHDPGITGYMIAIATDRQGCPIRFNRLIGSAYVKLASGHAAALTADAIPAIASTPAVCSDSSSVAAIVFDGERYALLPRTVALDSVASPNDANSTLLIVNRIGGDLMINANSLGALVGVLYDDGEKGFSFSLNGGCQLRGILSNDFPRTVPRVTQVIQAGRTGWIKLSSTADAAILGVAINVNANATSSTHAFNQGRNLHKLRLTTAASVTIPVIRPSC